MRARAQSFTSPARLAAAATALVLLAAHGAARAHGTRSVSIEVVEVSPGHATLQVRAQLASDIVRVTFEAPCTATPLDALARVPAAAPSLRIECPGTLAGATLRVDGLGPIVTEAILLYSFADGRTGSTVLRAEAPTANSWFARKKGLLMGEPDDITLDIRTMRKDITSVVATGALNGAGLPLSAGVLASLSAAVAQGWGDKDIGELARFFREQMGQQFN